MNIENQKTNTILRSPIKTEQHPNSEARTGPLKHSSASRRADSAKIASGFGRGTRKSIRVRIAHTPEMYEQAFRIAYEAYVRLGFLNPSPLKLLPSPYQLHPQARILIAYRNRYPVATMSIYPDAPRGVPSDNQWKEDLDRIRSTGRRLCEVGSLTVRCEEKKTLDKCLPLFRHAWTYARDIANINTFCAFVRKKHIFFYKKALLFRKFGKPQCCCWSALTIPNVTPLCVDLPEAERAYRSAGPQAPNTRFRRIQRFTAKHSQKIISNIRADLKKLEKIDRDELFDRFENITAPKCGQQKPA